MDFNADCHGLICAAAPDPHPFEGLTDITAAAILQQSRWPGAIDREAMVFVRFTVSAQGRVTQVEPVLDKGFYEPRFVTAAVATVKSVRFEPAKVDGRPVEFTGVIPVRFIINLQGSFGDGPPITVATGIGHDFRAELREVESLLKRGDYVEADQQAGLMLRDTVRTGTEYAALKVTLARTHAAAGQDDLALRFAEEATARNLPDREPFALHGPVPPNKAAYYALPVNIVKSLLELRMRVAARNGLLVEARRAYDELAGLEDIPADDPRSQFAAQVTQKLAGTDPLIANGRVRDTAPWHHELIRSGFSLEDVKGDIHFLSLTCSNGRQRWNYVPGEEWTVPADWRDCSVDIDGAPGSSFHFVEEVD